MLTRSQRSQAPLLLHRLQERAVMHRTVHDRIRRDISRDHHHRHAHAQPIESETLLSFTMIEVGRVRWSNWSRSNVIVAAAVFVESDDEQSILPVVAADGFGIANRLINFPNDAVAQQHTAGASIRVDR